MTSNPSPAIERQLREAWARKEWEFCYARFEYRHVQNGSETVAKITNHYANFQEDVFKYEHKDFGIPDNWRAQCKPPLDDEGDE